jgi:EpsI family protein
LRANFSRDGQRIYLELANYLTQRQDAELVNTRNFFIDEKHPVWRKVGETVRQVAFDGREFTVRQARLRSGGQRLLAWQWNVIDGRIVTSDHEAVLRLAVTRVLGGQDEATAVIIAAPYEGDSEPAERTLAAFARDMMPAIERALER